ncbi:MAG: hypothetical protein JSS98_08420 [Bacteroidetes bacterium]|nr:hypothetical protein [Bacteroidota bacterium]
MKWVLIFYFLFNGIAGIAQHIPTLQEVRQLYHEAASNEKACNQLILQLKPFDENNNPLLSGYKAGATMMMAQYVINPFSKLSYFNEGRAMLQKAVNTDAQNIELRFIRFCVQSNLPFFLGYKENIDTDKFFILNRLSAVTDISLKKNIVNFMKASNYVSEQEKIQLL